MAVSSLSQVTVHILRRSGLGLLLVAALLAGACQPVQPPAQQIGEEPVILVQGAPIRGANGIHFGPDDNLYIASALGREIVVMDPKTGEILNRLGAEEGVIFPDDLAFGPDGSLYWTDILVGEVGRQTPEGTTTKQFVAHGVNPITFSDDGRLFVALDFLGDGLFELDPDLVEPPRLIIEELGFLNGMDWGPDQNLYGVIWTQASLARVDVDAGTFTTVAQVEGQPAAAKFDSKGGLFAVKHDLGEVIEANPETGETETVATVAPGLDNLAFDSQDRLFVSGGADGFIMEVHADGTTRTVSPGGMMAPAGVAVMASTEGETVVVADAWSLRRFDGVTGESRGTDYSSVIGVTPFGAPSTVFADGDTLVVTSWFGNAVQVWDPQRGETLETYQDFAVPLNAIRFQDDLIVAELGTGNIVRMDSSDPSQRALLAEGLDVPAGLAATEDALWVGEWATGRILQIVDQGELLDTPVEVAAGLAQPEGMAVTANGSLLVVETGAGRLSSVNTKTGAVTVVAENLKLGAPAVGPAPPTWFLNGVAVGPSGTIYVTGDVGNVLYRIAPQG